MNCGLISLISTFDVNYIDIRKYLPNVVRLTGLKISHGIYFNQKRRSI